MLLLLMPGRRYNDHYPALTIKNVTTSATSSPITCTLQGNLPSHALLRLIFWLLVSKKYRGVCLTPGDLTFTLAFCNAFAWIHHGFEASLMALVPASLAAE
jgi:hypothetical protein